MNFFLPFSPLIRKIAKTYTSKERNFSFKNINVIVKPGVFHPGLFISTKMLLNFIDALILDNKAFLELGAGSGVISVLAAKKGARVFASDISKIAVENIRLNANINDVKINTLESNLFQNIPRMNFDYIVINPPYYKKDPVSDAEYAWYCGSNFEYFRNLFTSLPGFVNQNSNVFMILSEVCDIEEIKKIGIANGFKWKVELSKTVWGERNFIFRIFPD